MDIIIGFIIAVVFFALGVLFNIRLNGNRYKDEIADLREVASSLSSRSDMLEADLENAEAENEFLNSEMSLMRRAKLQDEKDYSALFDKCALYCHQAEQLKLVAEEAHESARLAHGKANILESELKRVLRLQSVTK